MPIIESLYNPPRILKNGHIQTLYPYFFRKVKHVNFDRKRIQTRDSDFIDLDCIINENEDLIILTHGLEGGTASPYIQGMAKFFSQNENKDVIAWNMRGCSGENNILPKFYHAASIEDIEDVVNHALNLFQYKRIHLIGFSLGGSLTLNYISRKSQELPSQIKTCVLFSTPLHLESSIKKLQSTKMGNIYSKNFLNTMKRKVKEKDLEIGLSGIEIEKVFKAKSFFEFDNLVTAPLHGFKNCLDYYQKASSKAHLEKINIPTLIVQAKDDPFLSKESFPIRIAKKSSYIHLEITPTGGHVGFLNIDKKFEYWSEKRASEFINSFYKKSTP